MMQMKNKLSAFADDTSEDDFGDSDGELQLPTPNSNKLDDDEEAWDNSDENGSTVDTSNNDTRIQTNNNINVSEEPSHELSKFANILNNKEKRNDDSDSDWDDLSDDNNHDSSTPNNSNTIKNQQPTMDAEAIKKLLEEQRRKLTGMSGINYLKPNQSLNDDENENIDSEDDMNDSFKNLDNTVERKIDIHDDNLPDKKDVQNEIKSTLHEQSDDSEDTSEVKISTKFNQDANDSDTSEWDDSDDSSDTELKLSQSVNKHDESTTPTSTLIEQPQKTEQPNSVRIAQEGEESNNASKNLSSPFSKTTSTKIEDSNKTSQDTPALADDKILNSIHSSFFTPPYLNIQEKVVQQKTTTVTRCKVANTFSFVSLIVSCIMVGVVMGLTLINLRNSLITYLSFSLLISFILLGFNLWFGISETVEDRTVVTESKLPSSELPSKKAILFWKKSDYSTKKKANNEKSYVKASVKDKYGDKDEDETFDFDGDFEERYSKISEPKPSQPTFVTPEELLSRLSEQPDIQGHFKKFFDMNEKLVSSYKSDLDQYERKCSELERKVDTLNHKNSILTNQVENFTLELTKFREIIEKDPNCASLEERKIIERINRDYATKISFILNKCKPEQKNADSNIKDIIETKLVFREIPEKKRYPRKYLRKVKRVERLETEQLLSDSIPNIRNGKWYLSLEEMFEAFKQDMKTRIPNIEDMEARERTSIIPHIKSSGDDDFRDSRDFSQQEMYEIRNGVYQHKTELYNFGLDNIQFSSEVFAPQNKIRELCKKRKAILSVK
ncbi:hypothetical protein C9374_002006 [Naegleria lovaniensis]|uniref:Uncharacterized protein n=1 Tax=Naegleria lovaniensis TaxID=51637 RepID=A0AA88GRB1_NAELO|nr:uncharacterized protein C9374_002006 [Naegleria lovaniensis]KAG2386971.1 hypothetical protein C9374_002006 [Naegleria lovaniensis]